MIKKMKIFFANNVILSILLVVIFVITGCMAWKYTMHFVIDRVQPINCIDEQSKEYAENETNIASDNRFEYTTKGIVYHSPSGVDAGPFNYLYSDEFYFSWNTIARYIGDNGKYGYLNKDGSLLTEPIFVEAAEFQDGTARVQKEDGKIYYIDEDARRITKDYLAGASAFEMQGLYCRVQTEDGKWGIINRKDEMIFSGADLIQDLPTVTCLGSAVVDGKAVLFELIPFEGNEEIKIIARYDFYVKISYVYCGNFAFVWTDDDLMGVVDYNGDVIVSARYQNIEFAYIGEEITMNKLVFLARDDNGTVHVIKAREKI